MWVKWKIEVGRREFQTWKEKRKKKGRKRKWLSFVCKRVSVLFFAVPMDFIFIFIEIKGWVWALSAQLAY